MITEEQEDISSYDDDIDSSELDDLIDSIEDETFDDDETFGEEVESENENEEDTKPKSKHKEKGKHALKYDSIFKGKKQDDIDNEHIIELQPTFNADNETSNGLEQRDQFEYERIKKLNAEIYRVMESLGKINIDAPRRKPSKVEFNRVFSIIVSELDMDCYSHMEVFTEYAFNFSENLENMFKLLDNHWGGKISLEMQDRRESINRDIDEIDFM